MGLIKATLVVRLIYRIEGLMSISVVQYLDEGFIAASQAEYTRPHDLSSVAEIDQGLVVFKFSHSLDTLPLLPDEARQMADTLNQLADLADPPEDE